MGSIDLQPDFTPVLRRDLMAAVNTCARDLKIRQSTLVVLDALVSFLPCQDKDRRETPVTPHTLLTVYAGNDTLCFRAKGLTDRQLRRHLDTLEAAGLMRRRDSANGKRFPIMRQGKTIGAFGLDLSPLFAKAGDILALAARRKDEAAELRGLRARILSLRAACLTQHPKGELANYLDGLRNLVRRASLTLTEAQATLNRLTRIFADHKLDPAQAIVTETDAGKPATDPVRRLATTTTDLDPTTTQAPETATEEMTACDGRNVRHTEQDSDTEKKPPPRMVPSCWQQLTEVSAFFPPPQDRHEAIRVLYDFAKMLRIGKDRVTKALARLDSWKLLQIMDRMAGQAGQILNPDAYFRSALRR